MKKSVKATIICMLVVAILNAFVFSAQAAATGYTDDTYVTPYGATVDISRWDGYTISETYFSMSHYPSATLVATGDYAYNCFTYAMIYDGNIDCASQLSSDQKFCIEDAEDLLGSGNVCFNRISFDEIQAGDLVFYKWPEINNGTSDFYAGMAHVAIVTQPAATVQDTYVVSKWGVWDVYSHKITECPYSNAGGGSLTVTSTGNNFNPFKVSQYMNMNSW